MQLSLTKFPWWGQIGAFVVVSALAVFGFWKFYVAEIAADIQMRKTRLTALRADVAKGQATARQLPQFQSQVSELENRLENLRQILPEQKDVADTLRRIETLAAKSNLAIQRFTPGKVVQQKLYAEIPVQARGRGHVPQPRPPSSIRSASSRASSTSARSRSRRRRRPSRTAPSSPSAWRRRSCCRKARFPAREATVPKQPSVKK